jgi:cbb3-type cytochrome oxidase subunit 3
VTVTYHLPSKEAFLRLTSNLKVTSGAGTTTATATAWVIPWILIAILVLFVGFIWYRRRRRRRAAEGAEPGDGDLEPAAVATSSV